LKVEGCSKVLSDTASGKSMAGRPQLDAALAELGAGHELVIAEWDRATRSMWDGLHIIKAVIDVGATTRSITRVFQLQPLANEQEDIEALALNILGLQFVLLLEPPDESKYPFLRGAKYRPGRILISYPASTNWLTMSWDDGRSHEHLTIKFVQPVPASS
jgi:hypothetical protein